MNVFLKWVGIIVIAGVIFVAGLLVGSEPTEGENKKRSDLIDLASKYEEVHGICEQKYQYAINGQYDAALQLLGRQDVLLQQIDELLRKYEPEREASGATFL